VLCAAFAGLAWPAVHGTAVTRAGNGPVSIIDWVDFVRFHGIIYLSKTEAGRPLRQSDLGIRSAVVRFKVADVVHDIAYRVRDGDAAFLAIGTPLFRVKGYASTFRLAARTASGIELFEADSNPRARHGGDLLDIRGKVQSIGIDSVTDGKHLADIVAPRTVALLVAAILGAPVDQNQRGSEGDSYALVFRLKDGTQVIRGYWPVTGEVERGILTPPIVRDAVRTALGA
jgi:hypothetical protein